MSSPLLVVSALPREIAHLARRLLGVRVRATAGLAEWQATLSARTVVLVATGCGPGPTTAALGTLIPDLKPACIVSTGICGAIVPSARLGDLILADSVRREEETSPREAPSALLPSAIVALSEAAVRWHRGPIISMQRVVSAPGEKVRLATETGATAVDMESAWVAEAADRAGVPWLALRAVMDGLETPPAMDYGRFIADDGSIRTLRLILHALVRPWLWNALSYDGERVRLATEVLSRALTRLLATLRILV